MPQRSEAGGEADKEPVFNEVATGGSSRCSAERRAIEEGVATERRRTNARARRTVISRGSGCVQSNWNGTSRDGCCIQSQSRSIRLSAVIDQEVKGVWCHARM